MIDLGLNISQLDAVRILPHYRYDDYLHWEGKWEIIEGIPYAMMPAPFPEHQQIAVNLSTEFRVALKNCAPCKVYQPIDYILSDETILQPDLLIVCKPINKKFLDFSPELVVEILSPATALKDRHTKFSLYESQAIPYYIIVDPATKEAEVYSLSELKYQLQQKGRDFSHTFNLGDCMISIDFAEIWQ